MGCHGELRCGFLVGRVCQVEADHAGLRTALHEAQVCRQAPRAVVKRSRGQKAPDPRSQGIFALPGRVDGRGRVPGWRAHLGGPSRQWFDHSAPSMRPPVERRSRWAHGSGSTLRRGDGAATTRWRRGREGYLARSARSLGLSYRIVSFPGGPVDRPSSLRPLTVSAAVRSAGSRSATPAR